MSAILSSGRRDSDLHERECTAHAEGTAPLLLGHSAAMTALRATIERFARSDAAVLITGETGTGKELVARAIHQRSARGGAPFVAVNCAALPEQLLESELFGHVRGAFTGADSHHTGLLARAGGGTLLLDELGEMPVCLQPKLLRVLQERSFRPVGGTRELAFDGRIVAATNQQLETAVAAGRFRADLLFRLDVLRVHTPPLRQRKDDILALAEHYLATSCTQTRAPASGFDASARACLEHYTWPGNVRELFNCVEYAVAVAAGPVITVADLPDKLHLPEPAPLAETGELLPMREVERRHIERVLTAVAGNKRRAAKILGFDRATLYRRLARYNLLDDC